MTQKSDTLCISSRSSESASLFFTDDYFVMKGTHYTIHNWQIKKDTNNISIPISNILDIDFTTIRSKKAMMCFIIIMSFLFLLGKFLFSLYNMIHRSDSTLKNIPSVYKQATGQKLDILALEIIEKSPSDIQKTLLLLTSFFILIFLFCAASLLYYYIFPARLLRITSIGGTFAVQIKCYDKEQLDTLVESWKRDKNFCYMKI